MAPFVPISSSSLCFVFFIQKADDDHQKAQHQAAALAAAASSASGTLGRCVGSTSSRSSSMLTATMDSRRQTFHQQLAQTSSHRSLVQDEIEILETNIGGSSLGGATSITLLSSGAMAGPSTPLSSMGRRKKFPGSDCSNNTKGHALPNRSPDLIGTATAAAAAAGSSSPEFKRRL